MASKYERLRKLVVEAHLGGLCEKHGVAPDDKCPDCRLEVEWGELRKTRSLLAKRGGK